MSERLLILLGEWFSGLGVVLVVILTTIAATQGDQLIGIAAVISSVATLLVAIRTFREVKTINSKSLANLADEEETRRVRAIPEAKQTFEDRSHLHSIDKQEQKKK